MKALVVPTVREASIDNFLYAWRDAEPWDVIIVVEDNPEPTFNIDVTHHYSWKDIDETLGEDAWIISRRDSAIRSFGFLKAYQLGADHIFTLDDDCFPVVGQKFCESHIKNLELTPKWCESIPAYRTRGLPYKELGILNNIVMSVGLWEGVPDHDAIHMLSDHLPPPTLPPTRVMPVGQYFPLCGMNFAFKREVASLTYFPLMGMDQPFARFDDIWFGVICKKICDHLGLLITCGEPYIYHSKASDPFINLVKEAPGVKYNETFWQVIDSLRLSKYTPAGCMTELGMYVEVNAADDYMKKLGRAMVIWASLFSSP